MNSRIIPDLRRESPKRGSGSREVHIMKNIHNYVRVSSFICCAAMLTACSSSSPNRAGTGRSGTGIYASTDNDLDSVRTRTEVSQSTRSTRDVREASGAADV